MAFLHRPPPPPPLVGADELSFGRPEYRLVGDTVFLRGAVRKLAPLHGPSRAADTGRPEAEVRVAAAEVDAAARYYRRIECRILHACIFT